MKRKLEHQFAPTHLPVAMVRLREDDSGCGDWPSGKSMLRGSVRSARETTLWTGCKAPDFPAPKNDFLQADQSDHRSQAAVAKISLFLFYRNHVSISPSRTH